MSLCNICDICGKPIKTKKEDRSVLDIEVAIGGDYILEAEDACDGCKAKFSNMVMSFMNGEPEIPTVEAESPRTESTRANEDIVTSEPEPTFEPYSAPSESELAERVVRKIPVKINRPSAAS